MGEFWVEDLRAALTPPTTETIRHTGNQTLDEVIAELGIDEEWDHG